LFNTKFDLKFLTLVSDICSSTFPLLALQVKHLTENFFEFIAYVVLEYLFTGCSK